MRFSSRRKITASVRPPKIKFRFKNNNNTGTELLADIEGEIWHGGTRCSNWGWKGNNPHLLRGRRDWRCELSQPLEGILLYYNKTPSFALMFWCLCFSLANNNKFLSDFGIRNGSRLQADDFLQDYTLLVNVIHRLVCSFSGYYFAQSWTLKLFLHWL